MGKVDDLRSVLGKWGSQAAAFSVLCRENPGESGIKVALLGLGGMSEGEASNIAKEIVRLSLSSGEDFNGGDQWEW